MIGLVTNAKYPRLTDDDRPLIAELAALGTEAVPVVWSDAGAPWKAFDTLVLRSCWDYHLRPAEFLDWLDRVDASGTRLWNPSPLVRWNMHKGYLRDLESRGVPVPHTEWLRAGDDVTLAAVLDMHGWTEAIVKPAISASATDTWRTSGDRAADEARFSGQLRRSDVLVQALIPEIASRGEWSLMFIGGAYSHATMKRPSPGDFRVQTEHGGTAIPAHAPDHVVAAAARVIDALPAPVLFARIDGVETERGWVLMEAECIEPVLFFEHAPDARRRFARSLVLGGGRSPD